MIHLMWGQYPTRKRPLNKNIDHTINVETYALKVDKECRE